jgi:hypothetical protein
MATFAFSKSTNQIQINSYVDEQPGEYDFAVDALNNILVITAKSGGYRAEIHTLRDTITISGSGFSGTAAQLKTQLLSDIFTASGSSATVSPTAYASNAERLQRWEWVSCINQLF